MGFMISCYELWTFYRFRFFDVVEKFTNRTKTDGKIFKML